MLHIQVIVQHFCLKRLFMAVLQVILMLVIVYSRYDEFVGAGTQALGNLKLQEFDFGL